MAHFINHHKNEKVDKWARKKFPERYPKINHAPATDSNEGDQNGQDQTNSN